MKRSHFFKKMGIGIGAVTISPFAAGAFNGKETAEIIEEKIIRSGEGKQLNVIGDKITLKLTGKDTGGKYVLVEQNNEPGIGIPPHVHENEDEIFRVIEGQLEVQIADQKTVLGPGDMVLCPRGIPHTWKVVGDSNAKVDLSFYPAGMEGMFEELAQLPDGPPDMEVVSEICGRYGIKFV